MADSTNTKLTWSDSSWSNSSQPREQSNKQPREQSKNFILEENSGKELINLDGDAEDSNLICSTEISKIFRINKHTILKKVYLDTINHSSFETEILAFISGKSNYFPTLLSFSQEKNETNIYLKYIEGVDAFQFIDENKDNLNEQALLYIFHEMVRSVYKCHSLNIIHRDIKLENFIVTPEGNICLIDWGMATLLSKIEQVTPNCGTPEYIDPEMVLPVGTKYKTPSLANDIWGLGVILYVLFRGTFPFDFSNVFSTRLIVGKLQRGETPAISIGRIENVLIQNLLRLIFSKGEHRPTAEEILSYPLFSKESLNKEKENIVKAFISIKNDL